MLPFNTSVTQEADPYVVFPDHVKISNMLSVARRTHRFLQRRNNPIRSSSVITGGEKFSGVLHLYSTRFVHENVEDSGDSSSRSQQGSTPSPSLAKSLADLLNEPPSPTDNRRGRTRMELKRSIELRIKKRVKAQYLNGTFRDLMHKVVANADTLRDSYDIIRLNSNVELASDGEDLCFLSIADQLATGNFDIRANSYAFTAKRGRKECLVLPKLQLRIIQEAIRVVLEVVYRPHFSKISHGCRSGRGRRSAVMHISKEIQNSDWCFTLSMNKEADDNVLTKLISMMEEKIVDAHLLTFIRHMFDARVINLTFGGFPKGHGLPQEGALSPILMNIYLDFFDHEVFRISMRYEGLGPHSCATKDGQSSGLRCWVRRQIKVNNEQSGNGEGLRLHVCRFMDEIFVSVSSSKEITISIKNEMVNYLRNSLLLDVEDRDKISRVKDSSRGLQFLGTELRVISEENNAVRAVHKLKDKVQLFASQKQEVWDSLTLRIGKKWLAHGLRRIKESEIEALGLSTPLLDQISQFRKEGMKTDHWFKSLIKIWMQDVKANDEHDEDIILSKYIAEPALPQDLRDAFYNFQKQAKDYVSSETAATLALLPSQSRETAILVTRVDAPISYIKKTFHRYGLINIDGFPRYVSALVLQDDHLIINWFSGLVRRWFNWYSEFNNFQEIKLIIVECVRKSCIRTLAAKYRIHEDLIQKKFELEASGIPSIEEFETEMMTNGVHKIDDEGLMYGISYSGLCLLSLSRVKVPARVFNCFVLGCSVASPSLYTVHVKERQRFPGWLTGFSTSIHPSLNGRRIGLCCNHVRDLYLGHISLQSIEFGALSR